MQVEKFYYDNRIEKSLCYATILWGAVGMLVGLIAALQLVFPAQFPNLNFNLVKFWPYSSAAHQCGDF